MIKRFEKLFWHLLLARKLWEYKYRFALLHQFKEFEKAVWVMPGGRRVRLIISSSCWTFLKPTGRSTTPVGLSQKNDSYQHPILSFCQTGLLEQWIEFDRFRSTQSLGLGKSFTPSSFSFLLSNQLFSFQGLTLTWLLLFYAVPICLLVSLVRKPVLLV